MPSKLKNYAKLPVHIVEDHNDALFPILRSIGSKHVPLNNNLMIHFDSHPDLLIPADLKASEVADVPVMLEKLSIENWILVMAYAGHVSSIVWIKPPWANQIENGDYNFFIGRQKNTDNIRVSCPILYFVSETLYCQEDKLEESKPLKLLVRTMHQTLDLAVANELTELINTHNNHYMLDIDLDFFTTMNPFMSMHKEVQMYDRLKFIYQFSLLGTTPEEISLSQESRQANMATYQNIFHSVQELKENNAEIINENIHKLCGKVEDEDKRAALVSLISDLSSECGDTVDWEIIHDAGCTCDDEKHQLPHHVSTNEEIISLVETSDKFLSSFPDPIIVTLARSSLDSYCPPNQVDMVQELVCGFLRKTHDIECILHYDT